MGRFAWLNLLTRPLRTFLALVGLSVPILGVLGLFSVSDGLRNLVGSTLDKIKGVMVLRENVPTPVFSHLPASLGDRLRAIPGVRAVAPEVWGLPPTIENVSLIPKTLDFLAKNKEQKIQSFLDATIIQGQDIAAHKPLKSAVYPNALKEGRFLTVADENSKNIVISRKIAKEHKDASGKPQAGRRPAQDRLGGVHHHRDLRDRLVPARPGDRDGHQHRPEGRERVGRQGVELLRRGRRPLEDRRGRQADRGDDHRPELPARRPEHVRVRRQLRRRSWASSTCSC